MQMVAGRVDPRDTKSSPMEVGCEEVAVAECREEFERLLCYARGDAQAQEIHEAERGIYAGLLRLGLVLLGAYLARKGIGSMSWAMRSQGKVWRRHGTKRRTYLSIFGAIVIVRSYFHREGEGGFCPLDAELNLREDKYSRLLCEWANFWSVRQAFAKVSDWLQQMLGLRLWSRPLEKLSRSAAEDAEAFQAEHVPVEVSEEAELLVVSADCKGVPMRRPKRESPKGKRRKKGEKANKKRMATVTAIYHVARHERTPADFMTGGWSWLAGEADREEEKPPKGPKPEAKRVWATFKGKDHAVKQLENEVARRDPQGAADLVILTDGEKALHQRLAAAFPKAKAVILDIVHVIERLWGVANALNGEGSKAAEDWVGLRVHQLLIGNVGYVLGGMKQVLTKRGKRLSANARKQLRETITYFTNNRDRMKYHEYIAAGYPIATGVIEGTCRYLVKDRMELAGMRWTEEGAEAVLALRAIQVNGDWDAFWRYRHRCDHGRVHGAHAAAKPMAKPGLAA